ncbi:hypothetical protein ASZ90_011350 [hydrocarbon metagenome]|uniref:Uncharacterized protein n=1 Tax=hydrocarbon metagenome TaxID=938273 RepID=A0A0W8FF34_9ZZZZ
MHLQITGLQVHFIGEPVTDMGSSAVIVVSERGIFHILL